VRRDVDDFRHLAISLRAIAGACLDAAQLLASFTIDHMQQHVSKRLFAAGRSGKSAIETRELRRDEFLVQTFSATGQIEKALPAILQSLLLKDVTFLYQLAQNPAKRLFGDLEYVEQLCHRHAGIAAHEMKHAMMGAPEADLGKDMIGIGGKVAISKKEKLDQLDERLVRSGQQLYIYVSHIDIFLANHYRKTSADGIIFQGFS
jgi:hypothetical protein